MGLLQAAAAAGDEENGAHYAEELAQLEQDIADNKEQVDNLESLYKQNTEIIATSIREIQKFERDFAQTKTRVAVSRQLESLSGLMKSSVSELQGMLGGEVSQSMQQLRESAAKGEGQMRSTMDIAKSVGSGIARQQEMRKARGKHFSTNTKRRWAWCSPTRHPPRPKHLPRSGKKSRSEAPARTPVPARRWR